MIYFFLAIVIVVCVVLASRLGKRDGERKALKIAVHPTPVSLKIDPALIHDVLAAEGWTISRPDTHNPSKPKPH